MAIDFDKIDKSVDLEGLRKDVEEASANLAELLNAGLGGSDND